MLTRLVKKYERKRTRGTPKRRLEESINFYLREVGWKDVEGIHLAQNRVRFRAAVKTVMKPYVNVAPEELFASQKGLCVMEKGSCSDNSCTLL
jgi:hypothetical protein